MIFSQLAYGLVVLTYFSGGNPIFYATENPSIAPHLNAGTLIELAEGVNERAAAIRGYDNGYVFEGSSPDLGNIVYTINEDFGQIPFSYTTVEGTNAGYTVGGVDYRPSSGWWKAWDFNALEGNPSYQGSRASYRFMKTIVASIDAIAPYYVRTFTNDSATFWNANDLWSRASGRTYDTFGADTGDRPFTGTVYGVVGTSQLWTVYRALTNLTTTTYQPGIIVTEAQGYANVSGAGPTPDYTGALFTNTHGYLNIQYSTEEVQTDAYSNNASKAIWHGYVVPPNLASGVVARIDASFSVLVCDSALNEYALFDGATMGGTTTCNGVSASFGPSCEFTYSAPEISTLMTVNPNDAWVSYITWPRGVIIEWTFSRCHP